MSQKAIKAGDLVLCGGHLVTVVEVRDAWATVRTFAGESCDRLVATLTRAFGAKSGVRL